MDSRPIGIFDSGLGGLTALRALRRFLPDENIVYFADSGRVPYGEKSLNQLRCMAEQNYAFISSHDVKAILVACGTMSSNCGDLLEAWPVPTVGVLYSSADWMRRLEGKGPIAVIATEASIRSGSYQKALKEACAGREVIAVSCPDFVPLIESGHIDPKDPLLRDAVARYLQPVREIRAEALLLGCTHYGIIEAAVREFLGPEITLVSAAESGAAALCSRLLKEKQTGGSGKTVYYTSGKAEDFSEAAALFLGCEKTEIRAEAIPPQPVPET
ncbi:MAG: glutamate racemase [Oscillospiraceae bacterium]|jgi:glutamate racemase|nr:glutamate racemase [Oscillospiraceae bacterium]MBQ5427832.1 glutamate racemase [Oscillospiraceae bacterium]